jgi:hypothetical protein
LGYLTIDGFQSDSGEFDCGRRLSCGDMSAKPVGQEIKLCYAANNERACQES